jgi:hypothetical protein
MITRHARRRWPGFLALTVAVAICTPVLFAPAAFAETTAEADCITLIGGGVYGGNTSSTAACEKSTNGISDYNVAGVNTSGSFTGHLEFDYFGSVGNYFNGDSWGSHGTGIGISNPPPCPTGTVSTTLWRYNGGSNYTNMGTATIDYTCDAPNTPSTSPPGGYILTPTSLS